MNHRGRPRAHLSRTPGTHRRRRRVGYCTHIMTRVCALYYNGSFRIRRALLHQCRCDCTDCGGGDGDGTPAAGPACGRAVRSTVIIHRRRLCIIIYSCCAFFYVRDDDHVPFCGRAGVSRTANTRTAWQYYYCYYCD